MFRRKLKTCAVSPMEGLQTPRPPEQSGGRATSTLGVRHDTSPCYFPNRLVGKKAKDLLVAVIPALLLCIVYLIVDYAYGIPSALLTIPLCLIIGPVTFIYRKRKRARLSS